MNVVEPNTDPLTPAGHSQEMVLLPGPGMLHDLCAAFLEDPGCTDTIDVWAARFATTRKTLYRLFRRELHTSFDAWRREARIAIAWHRLTAGERVTRVALELGYDSCSAFSTMFRRGTGIPPSAVTRNASQRSR